MARNNIFRLVEYHRYGDNAALLQRLAEQEREGDIVGLVVVTMCRRRPGGKQYTASTSGWADKNSTFALGALSASQTLLANIALQDAGLI